ncbi:glucosyltransferase domain-containing protein [Pseudomonas sp. efr-133-TYG-5]|uniref:glucosyltransferase domain-containing protein n=1 Tax=Pseudomonas sp. efr-133-TYG-5 TaxID=3040310 RepID=UPI00255265F7|nr:glucosyltransferase domain-containing protein [Pseudomonas sp. efr-133-TYG-5]
MRARAFLERELSQRQVVLFFLLAGGLFILPLILADFPYIDDNWRTLAAGNAWAGQGRLFADWLYQALTFTGAAPNIFPLPLLLACVAMSFALTRLTFHYFPEPSLACCLVVLPLWYNPFLLQNLSYQYDGPGMLLSLVAVVYAITFQAASRVRQWLVPALLLALAIGLYQISVNVFLGLCCVELVRAVEQRRPAAELGNLLAGKLAQLGLGVLIYSVTAYPFMTVTARGDLLDWSRQPLLQIGSNLSRTGANVALLWHGGYAWLLVALGLCAAWAIARCGRWPWQLVCLAALAVTALLVPGITLVFRDFNDGARTLMGYGVWLLLLCYLAYRALASVHRRLPLLLIVPLLATLSLAFAYGRVLTLQKTFASAIVFSLGHDIAAHRELYAAKRIYLSVTYSDRWLLGASGSFEQLPVLHYLLNVDYAVLAENLPGVGIGNVVAERERRNATRVGYRGYPALLETRFYRIYLLGDYGFIVLKEPAPIDHLRW